MTVNNPLGSKAQGHKLSAFYYTIQNLPQYFNSFLGTIHVFAICNTVGSGKYGMGKILVPFLANLAELESNDGVHTVINGNPVVLRASIACVCADGLAAHQLFGFLSPAQIIFVVFAW